MAFSVCGDFWWLRCSAETWFMRHSPLNAALAKLSKLHLKEAKGIEFEKWIFCPMRPLVGKSGS